ncbi:MAG TPA: stage II sporulation protein M [Verrucomicrobiae bacterium]|nr:stage II sporulation protein M [Verrucomicrobiae bacterium]
MSVVAEGTPAGDASALAPPAAPRLILRSSEFRKGREAGWRELEGFIKEVERRSLLALSVEELQRLPLLYRSALSSLSVARSIALDRNLLLYLENLCFRAFLIVYGPRIGIWRAAVDFFRRGFPEAVRSARWHILLSAFCLLVGLVAGFVLTVGDESWFSSFVPAGLADGRGPASNRSELLSQEIFAPWDGFTKTITVMATFLFQNNTTVGILAFSLGIAGGVPTALLTAYQGLTLGAFIALHWNRDLTIDFLGWTSIHGVTELTAIVLCGAAGFMLAERVLFPGRHARLENLAIHGREAARLAVGAIFMLFVAALIEGCLRQLVASTPLRFAIGGATGALWLAYFLLAGRRARP